MDQLLIAAVVVVNDIIGTLLSKFAQLKRFLILLPHIHYILQTIQVVN
jgi:hypothetical protein